MASTAKRGGGGVVVWFQDFLPSHRKTPGPMALHAIIGQGMNHFIEKYF